MLTIKDFSVSVDGKKILKDLNYTFSSGKTYAIMGPNGSGKSTLAYALMGHSQYKLSQQSKILLNKQILQELKTDQRARRAGLFMSFQTPISLSGVNIFQLLRYAMGEDVDVLKLKKKLQAKAKKLNIEPSLLERSLNEGFSGGERKKMEILQALIIKPNFLIFDEIDTGVDIDAIKIISQAIKSLKNKKRTIILITHHNRILKSTRPDEVIILRGGKIVETGDYRLAERIEKRGYGKLG